MKRICIVTSTRAEFGLLLPLIKKVIDDDNLELKLAVTGTHLSKNFGETYKEIIQNNIPIDEKIDILQNDDGKLNVLKVMSTALTKFGEYFSNLKPDLLVILGDRYEMLSVAEAAMVLNIPIAHIHGGETTQGAIDEAIRHSISKMSYLHFTSCESYRNRVIQLGEDPARVFNVGALGVENIKKLNLMSLKDIEKSIDFDLSPKFCLVTFHPVTLDNQDMTKQFTELLSAISKHKEYKFIFTKSNADSGGNAINNMIDKYVENNSNCIAFYSLGFIRYLSAMKYCSMVIGNSSSGIIETPSFCVPTINIGDRQKGRLQAESIINCKPEKEDVLKAFDIATSKTFQESIKDLKSPYDGGNTSDRIVTIIKDFLFNKEINLQKKFYDIEFEV